MVRMVRLLPAIVLLGVACGIQGQQAKSSEAEAHSSVQPFTAEFKITRTQTLGDGTTVTSEGTELRARNSSGITMQSNTNEDWRLGRMLGTAGGVHDTDGTILANWYSVTKEGRIFKMPPKEQRHGCWQSANLRMNWGETARPPERIVFNEATKTIERMPDPVQHSRPQAADLGMTMIEGVQAHGQRITRTIAVGEAGNDRTIVVVEESWMAPSLGLMVRESVDDPRIGKRTRELVSLTLDEPDPALFQPPQDYAISTEELHPVPCKQ